MSGEGPSTRAVHADAGVEPGVDVAPPLHLSTTYRRSGPDDELVYRRDDSRTVERLEAVLGDLEGGTAVAFASGMAAITATIRALAPARISLPPATYHGTRLLAELAELDGHLRVVDPDELGEGDVRWLETPANPTCEVADIAAISADARARGVRVVVDSTFATPVLQQPLALGADVVVHATTKAINGHSDALGGVAVSNDPQILDALRRRRVLEGAVMGAFDAWLTLRGVRTLPLRLERQCATAAALVEALEPHPVRRWYSPLPGTAWSEIARRQMSAGGSVFSFEFDEAATAAACTAAFELITVATSLGGVETLAEHRLLVDEHAPPGLIRLSVGIEDVDDLRADLLGAVEAALRA